MSTITLDESLFTPEGHAAWSLTPIVDHAQWERLGNQLLDNNYRQTWSYGLVSAERFNAKIEHVAIMSGSDVYGLAEVRLKRIPFLNTGIAYVGGGPLTRRGRGDDIPRLEICLRALREEYLHKRGYMLRILPPLHPAGGCDDVTECFKRCGFQFSAWPPPYRTLLVDISSPLPEIRKKLAQKWRNCLNKAERQGLTIRSGSEPGLFDEFAELFEKFLDRRQFSVELSADYFRTVRARAVSDDDYIVSMAMKDGMPVAGHLASMRGDTAVYLQGATGELALTTNAAYLLQWNAIVTGQQRGMKYYDLGGIDPVSMPGVYHFKQGMSGDEVLNPGPFQAAPQGLRALIIPTIERLYRNIQRWRRA